MPFRRSARWPLHLHQSQSYTGHIVQAVCVDAHGIKVTVCALALRTFVLPYFEQRLTHRWLPRGIVPQGEDHLLGELQNINVGRVFVAELLDSVRRYLGENTLSLRNATVATLACFERAESYATKKTCANMQIFISYDSKYEKLMIQQAIHALYTSKRALSEHENQILSHCT